MSQEGLQDDQVGSGVEKMRGESFAAAYAVCISWSVPHRDSPSATLGGQVRQFVFLLPRLARAGMAFSARSPASAMTAWSSQHPIPPPRRAFTSKMIAVTRLLLGPACTAPAT